MDCCATFTAAAAVSDRVQTQVVSASYFYTWDCFRMGTAARCGVEGCFSKNFPHMNLLLCGLDYIDTNCNYIVQLLCLIMRYQRYWIQWLQCRMECRIRLFSQFKMLAKTPG